MFCPVCRSEYADDWKVCPKDAATLLRSAQIGKYRIDQLLGAGGMGAVYRAYNPDTQSAVAIKLMHGGAEAGDAARQRFQREAASVAALRTRHVVGIYDFGSDVDGTLYLVMEYMQGHPLRAEIRPGPDAVPPPRVNFLVDQALRGLGAAHRAGIVHRDLKPENLYVAQTDDGEVVKILDFGIARVQRGDTPNLTHSGALMGTPAYMAPEQVAGNRGQVGPHSDVYAMAVIVYELFTGGSPFQAETLSEVLSRILSRQFTPLAQLRPDLPPAIAALVDRAMADDPAHRFAHADAMREAWAAAWSQFPTQLRMAPVPGYAGAPATPPHQNLSSTPAPVRTPEAVAGTMASAATAAPTAGGTGGAGTYDPSRSVTPGPVVVDGTAAGAAKGSRVALWATLGVLVAGGGVAAALVLGGGGGGGGGAGTGTGTGAAAAPDAAPPERAPIDAAAAEPAPARDDMVRFAGGTFTMGVDPSRFRKIPYVDAEHEATVGPFWLDRTEVTRPGERLPASGVTWHEADAHCRGLGKRLPTAAEWEHAARSARLDPRGARLLDPKAKQRPAAAPVGTHPGDCTPDGVCDLLGNVMEWTADAWPGDPDPTTKKVVRGASFKVGLDGGWYASVHARLPVSPDTADAEIGFRCAADAAPAP